MALGYLAIPYKSVVVPYNDEKTPIELTGKKMLPILKHDQGAMNESLDIMQFVDKNNKLDIKNKVSSSDFKELEELLNQLGNDIHSLAMPYWIYTPEFNESSRIYFQKKKEEKRGPFRLLVQNKDQILSSLEPNLQKLEKSLGPFYHSDHFTVFDILIAAHLWGLYIVPEFQFSPAIHKYLQAVKDLCKFNYHKDFWE